MAVTWEVAVLAGVVTWAHLQVRGWGVGMRVLKGQAGMRDIMGVMQGVSREVMTVVPRGLQVTGVLVVILVKGLLVVMLVKWVLVVMLVKWVLAVMLVKGLLGVMLGLGVMVAIGQASVAIKGHSSRSLTDEEI